MIPRFLNNKFVIFKFEQYYGYYDDEIKCVDHKQSFFDQKLPYNFYCRLLFKNLYKLKFLCTMFKFKFKVLESEIL